MQNDQVQQLQKLIEDSTTTPLELMRAIEALSYILVKSTREYKKRLNSAVDGLTFGFPELGNVTIDLEVE